MRSTQPLVVSGLLRSRHLSDNCISDGDASELSANVGSSVNGDFGVHDGVSSHSYGSHYSPCNPCDCYSRIAKICQCRQHICLSHKYWCQHQFTICISNLLWLN